MEPDARCLVGLSFVRLIFELKVQFSSTQLPSHLTLCLYEKRLTRRDVVIGTQEISVPVESQTGPFLIRKLTCSTS